MAPHPTRGVVELNGLSKTFGDQKALLDVDLTLAAGEVHALIGENGSGKSTLIKCLTGVYQPDHRGQITWGTKEGSTVCVAVHQDLGLIPGLTVAENFGIGLGFTKGRFGRISWGKHREVVAGHLATYHVDVNPDEDISDLTLAQRTLVTIARALSSSAGRAQLLILDEPTAALPQADRQQVVETARQLADAGMAVLYVSHHLDEIAGLADVVTVLRAGSVSFSAPSAGQTEASLLALMSGQQAAVVSTHREPDTAVVLALTQVTTTLLRGVDVHLHAGEVLGLVGAPDSGASDICRLAAGLLSHGGTVELAGQVLPNDSPLAASAAGLLLVPGDRRREGIVGELSVAANLELTALRKRRLLAPLFGKGQQLAALELMETLDVRPRDPRRHVGQLSGGNQQKVVIGRCLAADPKVLVLENPTQGVDPAARLQIRRLLRDAAQRGLAVLVCDVDEAEVIAVADRLLLLQDGLASSPDTTPALQETAS